MHQSKWKQYRTGLLKAKSTLDQAVLRYAFENGENPECGYWTQNPYKGKCTLVCKGYNSKGDCIGSYCVETGEDRPDDYYGNFKDCANLYQYFKRAMNVTKICSSNAYSNGCIPEYEGSDTIYKSQNPNATNEEVIMGSKGCTSFRKEKILTGMAFVNADGMIFFPFGANDAKLMAVDINGQAGPNKWGHDVYALQLKLIGENAVPVYKTGQCSLVEKGGVSAATLLYGKNYM